MLVNIAVGLSGQMLLFAKSMVKSVSNYIARETCLIHTRNNANSVRRYFKVNNKDNIDLIVTLEQLLFIVFNIDCVGVFAR